MSGCWWSSIIRSVSWSIHQYFSVVNRTNPPSPGKLQSKDATIATTFHAWWIDNQF